MSQLEHALFGTHANALRVLSRRNEVLAANIVNADTPNYKARDVDFRAALGRARVGTVDMARTDDRHIVSGGMTGADHVKYRLPMQPSQDGNTVEAEVEQASFAENAVRYQFSLMRISGRVRSLKNAISGATQ